MTPDTAYVYLDRRIDVMSMQMTEIMLHFCTMAATPGTTLSVFPNGTYVAAATMQAPVVLPDTPQNHPVLEPTSDVQGPPPTIATSNAELISDPAKDMT
jgi:hypothetical protein